MSRYASGHASAQLRRVAGALAQVEPPSGSNRIRARGRQRGAVKREPEPAQFFRMDEVNAPVSVNLLFPIELMSRAGSLLPQSSRPSTSRAACSHQAKTGRATSGDPHVGRCQATSSALYSFADSPILQRRKNRRLTKRSIPLQKMTQPPAFIKGRVTVCPSRSPLACPPRRTRQVSIKLLKEFHLIVCLPSTMCVRCSGTPAARTKHLPI